MTAGVALATTVSSVNAATAPCPDPGAICNIQCYNAPYCTVRRACWVNPMQARCVEPVAGADRVESYRTGDRGSPGIL
jgi:hypothetical protein